MILYFEQRISSLGSKFDIYDETGEVLYHVKGKLSTAAKFLLLDADENQIGMMEEVFFSVPPQLMLKKGEATAAIVKKKGILRHSYELDNGWVIEGDTDSWNWTLQKEDGSEVAQINRRLINGHLRYAVDTADGADEVTVILAILAVDMERCNQGVMKKTLRTLRESKE